MMAMNLLCARIFPLCVPSLSLSAENQLLQLVHCYLSTSSVDVVADDNVDDQCPPLYDVSSLKDAERQDVDGDVGTSAQLPNHGRWTVDNGELLGLRQ